MSSSRGNWPNPTCLWVVRSLIVVHSYYRPMSPQYCVQLLSDRPRSCCPASSIGNVHPCVAGHPAWRDTFPSGPSASCQRVCVKLSSTQLTLHILFLTRLCSDTRKRGVGYAVSRSVDSIYQQSPSTPLLVRDNNWFLSSRGPA
jgi:hypothetical protein